MSTFWEPATLALIIAAFFAGGTVKGAIGIGLPAVVMSLLSIAIDPTLAVTLLSVPILVTNAQQVLNQPGWRAIIARFWVAAVCLFVSIFVVSQFIDDVPRPLVNIVVGLSLVIFALAGLFRLRLPVTEAPIWQVLTGISAGIIGGLSSVKAPVMIYCAALELPRREFMAAAGFLFFSGGLGMLGGLSATGLLNGQTFGLSVAVLLVAILGFQAGAYLGRYINAALFRQLLLSAMLLLGLRLVIINLL